MIRSISASYYGHNLSSISQALCTEVRSYFFIGWDLHDSLVRRYPEIADKLQYISCKVNQLTSVEKEELRAAGKEVLPTSVIPNSDDEENNETKCIDLTKGDHDIHEKALKIA